ncbi:uncharacterized protein N0V89_009508 [Didymosphaeria variabile]|uniref:AB hydrolase-1 domain-containing protein n=1 Tax=Didymosphaeria variabile TaxID=1932322 RepID=A0A9W8XDI4_9PLEO|nr:uncharacterized protein N0V89_009508 [Didymosphaeria variabile]KAJ4348136.1 hypothetical protein N0V89_009508 [Didymosphaeria variabile]
MDFLTSATLIHPSGETTTYYTGGSPAGTPLIFIHGWPDLAQSWHHQLRYFTSPPFDKRYCVYALDMRGYANSSGPHHKSAYSLKTLVSELVDFAHQLNIDKAVWIGHDWGAAIVSSLAAHHPSLFLGMTLLCVPYRTLELGLLHTLSLINRSLYPKEEYPYGQWEYMAAYSSSPSTAMTAYSSLELEKWTKLLYVRHDPSRYGRPAHTSRVLRDGWFAGRPDLIPDLPMEATSLDQPLYEALLESHRKHGFFPPTAYYLNHEANAEYAKSEAGDGKLEFPVLYVDAKHDAVCSPSTTPRMADGQRASVKDLTVEVVEASHWVMLEKPAEMNSALERWLGSRLELGRSGSGSQV